MSAQESRECLLLGRAGLLLAIKKSFATSSTETAEGELSGELSGKLLGELLASFWARFRSLQSDSADLGRAAASVGPQTVCGELGAKVATSRDSERRFWLARRRPSWRDEFRSGAQSMQLAARSLELGTQSLRSAARRP